MTYLSAIHDAVAPAYIANGIKA